MKSIKNKIFLCCIISCLLLTNPSAFASSNKIAYRESGKTKYYRVTVTINNSKSTTHTISGEYQSGPSGHGMVYYTKNGMQQKPKKVYGTGQSSYWYASYKLSVGNIYKAQTFVGTKGLNHSVTDYYN
ncbi:hypothetical protein [Helcococcus kunzii]|uniref:hypothetical protein n=1 Tax=Helcococcus kunzii TaxID=40091 RepID=UPI0021A33C58|nr:hypothetical protein [Helcococcus kunzii]MCT1796800.1 hypothetical protein [Helcococcus kunzii]MCT1988358.1 hypothetical protein [Helcococcus kunzii]